MSRSFLTNPQKATLAILAGEAYAVMEKLGLTDDLSKEAWRKQEVKAITGKESTKECLQKQYVPLYNHFAVLAGKPPKKDRSYTPNERAIYLIKDALRKWEFEVAYLHKIALNRFPSLAGYKPNEILEAMKVKISHEALMTILYTINSRGREKMNAIAEQVGLDMDDVSVPYTPGTGRPPFDVGGMDHYETK